MKLEDINHYLRKLGLVLVIEVDLEHSPDQADPTKIYLQKWENYKKRVKTSV